MKIKDMILILIWLIKYMKENTPKEFKKISKARNWLEYTDTKRETLVASRINTKNLIMEEIEAFLREIRILEFEDRSDSDELRKPALYALARLMGIIEKDKEMSREYLEKKIIRFVEASA